MSTAGGGGATKRPRPIPEGTYAWRDVTYYDGEGAHAEKHKLDVYVAREPYPRPLQPIVLFVHGGGWVRGDRQHGAVPGLYDNVGAACAKAGAVGVVASYRLSPHVRHPEHTRDVARALRWIQQGHARRFGGDEGRVFLAGHSAGAHLCAMLLCLPWLIRHERLNSADSFLPAGVRGFIGISGVYNLQRLAKHPLGKWGLPSVFGEDPFIWSSASPCHVLGREAPLPIDALPVLLLNAERDFHLREDSAELLRLLAKRSAGGKAPERSTAVVPLTDHLTVLSSINSKTEAGNQLSSLLFDFVKRHA